MGLLPHCTCTHFRKVFEIVYFVIRSIKTYYGTDQCSFVERFTSDVVKFSAEIKGATQQHLELIKFLFQEGNADIAEKDWFGCTLLTHSVRHSASYEVIALLIELGADVNAIENKNRSVLFHAINNGNLDVVKLLIKSGADVNCVNNDGDSVLHYATDLNFCQWLVDSNRDLNGGKLSIRFSNNDGITILHRNVVDKSVQLCYGLVQLGKENGYDLVEDEDVNGQRPLHVAAKYNNLDVVKWLVNDMDANLHVKDKNNHSVLHEAAKYGDSDLCEWLFEKGLQVNINDDLGRSLLNVAVYYGNLDVVYWLKINHKAKFTNDMLFLPLQYNDVLKKFHTNKYLYPDASLPHSRKSSVDKVYSETESNSDTKSDDVCFPLNFDELNLYNESNDELSEEN